MQIPRLILIVFILLAVTAATASAALKMRPYSGIGVLQVSLTGIAEPVRLYDDPGIARCCQLEISAIRNLNRWLFGSSVPYLLVTARKGEWLEIEYDDAGRTAWIQPERRWVYTAWDQFLKGRMVQFLRNSPKKQMQLLPGPGAATGTPLQARQQMKVILAQGDWAYVLVDHSSAGWIRWRDSDSRLLIGFDTGQTP